MSLGTLTIVEEFDAVGPLKVARCTLVGDGAYPAGGSAGLEYALRQAAKEKRTILAVVPSGNNGDTHLEYISKGAPVDAAADASTDLLSRADAAAHGLSSGDPVIFELGKGKTNPLLPSGLVEGQVYYVIASGLTSTAFKVSATSGGSAVDLVTAGAGEFTFRKADKLFVRVMSTGVESAVSNQSGTTYGALIVSY